MEITKTTQPRQQAPATQSYKYYSEQELLNCLKGEHMTVKAVLSLIESNFEKDKAITELTQTVADNPNINLKDAMEFTGHRNVKTFINHYCFFRYSDEQKRQEPEKTLNV